MKTLKRKILVPIDLSSSSNAVANYALAIAERHRMHVVFVYVSADIEISITEDFMYIQDQGPDHKSLQQEFQLWSEQLASHSATFEARIDIDTTMNQLHDLINQLSIDMVCINAKAKSTDERFIAPLTIQFIAKCSVPVIVVPPDYITQLHEEFVFFTNFRSDDISSIYSFQKELIHLPRLHILHITNDFSFKKEQEIQQLKDAIAALDIFTQITHALVSSHSILHFIKEYIDTHSNSLAIIHMTANGNWFQRLVQRSITKQLLLLPIRPFVVV